MDLAQDPSRVFIASGGDENVQRKNRRRVDALLDYTYTDEGIGKERRFAAV